jgi:hypothetical protein
MRTVILAIALLTSLAPAINAQTLPQDSYYIGTIPHRTNAAVVFRVSLGYFLASGGPSDSPHMQLLARDVASGEYFMAFIANVTNRSNGIVRAKFPFGGRFRGRYDPTRNLVVGHFYGFPRNARPLVPQRRLEMPYYDQFSQN